MAFRTVIWLAAMAAAVWIAPAEACSPLPDYVRPSNYELVQIADAIVVATPEAQTGEEGSESLTFRIIATVKGAPPQRVQLEWAVFGRPEDSDLADISGSHPDGYDGPCNRMSFRRGQQYLLFIKQDTDGSWSQLSYPFSRINEDYAGENTVWMRVVRRYADLQRTLRPMEQIAALERMVDSGLDLAGRHLTAAERADIASHLNSISEWKPTAYLLAMYSQAERGTPLPAGIHSEPANREPTNYDELVTALLGEHPAVRTDGPAGHRLTILRALANGDHPEALALFERLAAAPEIGPRIRGLVLRYFARNGHYSRAYQWIETRLMAELLRLPRNDALILLGDVAEVQGLSIGENEARWRSDPHSAATWPELALSLEIYQVRTFGRGHTIHFSDAIGAIPVTDYRARPALTLALASSYGQDVRRWAIAELEGAPPSRLSDERNRDDGEDGENPLLLPLRVLFSAWQPDNLPIVRSMFCAGGQNRRLVISTLGERGEDLYGRPLLARLAATPGLSEEERTWLLRAAIQIAARDARLNPTRRIFSSENAETLVTRLARGETIEAEPISCSTREGAQRSGTTG